MRKTVLPLLITILTITISCNFVTRKEALQLNNTIVAINDSLYLKGREFGNLVGESFKTKDYSRLKPLRIDFERFLDSARQSMVRLKDVGGSEELKNCEIELLSIEKRMVEKDFIPFEQLTPSSTGEEVTAIFEVIKKDSKSESDQMQKLQKLQAEYARKNGFTLKQNALKGKKE